MSGSESYLFSRVDLSVVEWSVDCDIEAVTSVPVRLVLVIIVARAVVVTVAPGGNTAAGPVPRLRGYRFPS